MLQPHGGSGSATSGCARASTGRGGHSSGMAEEAAWPQQAQKEREEEGLHMGEDAETTPGAFCSKNRLISLISSPLPSYPSRPAASPHTEAASLLKSPADEAGRWLE